jgi:hypothetical protein
MDTIGDGIILNNVCHVPESKNRILPMIKFRRDHKIDFRFTGPETFSMTTVKGFGFTVNSVNDILYTTTPQIQTNVATNVAVTRDIIKRQIDEISSDTDSASTISEASELE